MTIFGEILFFDDRIHVINLFGPPTTPAHMYIATTRLKMFSMIHRMILDRLSPYARDVQRNLKFSQSAAGLIEAYQLRNT